jgi:hypothetical protein
MYKRGASVKMKKLSKDIEEVEGDTLAAGMRPPQPFRCLLNIPFYCWYLICFESLENVTILLHYHAIFAIGDLGYFLTKNFRVSSSNRRPIPNAIGKNQCATGTMAVSSTWWNFGTYRKKIAIKSAKMIAGTRYQLKR